jgi:hypothetical protein
MLEGAAVAAATAVAGRALAHNNPTMSEQPLLEIAVTPAPGGPASTPFAIVPPAGTVQLAWHVAEAASGLRFAVAQAGSVVLPGLAPGKVTRLVKGDGFTIVDVVEAAGPFTLRLVAVVATWPRG